MLKNRLLYLFENSPSGIAFINQQGLIEAINPTYCQLLGYSKEELLHQPFHSVVHSEDLDKVEQMLALMATHQPLNYMHEKRLLTKVGQTIFAQQNISILYDGELDSYYAIDVITDLSAKKRLILDLEKALSELKERNFELDQFVYRTSHDLRSPLATILGLINLIKLEKIPKVIKEYISLAENRVLKLDNFLQLLINYLRNTRLEVAYEPINFDLLIKECLQDLEYVKGFDHISIKWQIADQGQLWSDSLRLKIIFQNLISNAIKYQYPYSKESYLQISLNTLPDKCELIFKDNGVGMKQEHLQKITNMFFRASENSDGSGLGMYIVKQAIERLQGTITIESPNERGMITSITIPNHIP